MVPVSVVIITQNKAEVIAGCVDSVKLITDDIVLIDNNSTDGTTVIAHRQGCRVYDESWDGYGANKNKGNSRAKYDWILSIDADEQPDEELISALHRLDLDDHRIVYDIAFKSYFGPKLINFGSWGRDHHIRLFNRKIVRWSEPAVHETLLLPYGITIKKMRGHIHHYSVKDANEYSDKSAAYAKLCAEKYFAIDKKASLKKLYLAPAFHFLKNYLFFLGFLDGREGFEIASTIARHTRLKYRLLRKMYNKSTPEIPAVKEKMIVEYSS
ncbi:MAG: glycosyltransferase family 2 protein [Bacteroidetes bacterium]|nr:glycosyltransferase family 2 protein [Bacteroidota bacterium]